MTIKKTFAAAGLMALYAAAPAQAWERLNETRVADDGTPLVLMRAESGDALGVPWLVYLESIGYDTSGDWITDTFASLVNYNPEGEFVPGFAYGIYANSTWWLPDMEAINALSEREIEEYITRTDFLNFLDATAQDIESLQSYQESVETRLASLVHDLDSQWSEIQGIQAKLQTVQALKSLADANKERLDVLETWKRKREAGDEAIADSLASAQAQASLAAQQAQDTDKTVSDLMATVAELQQQVGKIQEKNSEQDGRIASNRSDIDELTEEKAAVMQRLDALAKRMNALTEARQESHVTSSADGVADTDVLPTADEVREVQTTDNNPAHMFTSMVAGSPQLVMPSDPAAPVLPEVKQDG